MRADERVPKGRGQATAWHNAFGVARSWTYRSGSTRARCASLFCKGSHLKQVLILPFCCYSALSKISPSVSAGNATGL